MSQADKPHSKQDKAIHDYLESLLLEVDDEAGSEEITKTDTDRSSSVNLTSAQTQYNNIEPLRSPQNPMPPHAEAEVSSSLTGLEKLVAEIPDSITETITEIKTQVALETLEQEETELEEETQLEQQAKIKICEPENIQPEVPDWAQSRFQCLLFKVSGLSLAVPLIKLNSVIPWNEEITKTPNKTDWYLGLVQHLNNQVKIIDTALLVMPENRRDKIDSDPAERLSHILLVDDYQWGLACDSIGEVIWLSKEEVKWRKNKTSRAWLSGTSLEHLCAIMDTEVFAQMLTEAS